VHGGRRRWPVSDARRPTTAEIRRDPEAKQRAIRVLWQLEHMPGRLRQPYLYAILDAARDERIYPGLQRLAATEEILCLYQGRAGTEMATVAPYLVCLGTSDRAFDWIWEEGWGGSWGIFLWSLVSPTQLRQHFRRGTMVRTEDGQRLLFRFYDPRVLRTFLPSCDAVQCRELFGPVAWFACESEFGDAIGLMREQNGRAVARATPLVISDNHEFFRGTGPQRQVR
jgi:hypothetical protein